LKRVFWLFALLNLALATTIEVQKASRLYLTPDGEGVVLEGDPAVVVLDGRTVEARRIVYDQKTQQLLLTGRVRYTDAEGRQVEAERLALRLDDEALIAIKVRLESQDLVFLSPKVCKNEGQIRLEQSFFSPCLACGQDPPDYAFRAREVTLYPGDRVVAEDVWVEIEGERVFYLPLWVYFTGPRRPKLRLGVSEADGLILEADLPYVTASGLGFTLLRYFERRGLGFGFDHWEVGPEKAHLYALYLPGEEGGLRLLAEWADSREGWKESLRIQRDDTRIPGRTRIEAEVKSRKGTEPRVAFRLRRTLDLDPSPPPLHETERLELLLAWPKGVSGTSFSVSGQAAIGAYEADTNPQNRSARAAGDRLQAGRLLVEHRERFRPRLPGGLFFSVQNDYSGYFYTTQEVQIRWQSRLQAGYRQGPWESGLKAYRQVQEGETPFAFDRLPTRRRATLTPYLRYRPKPWSFSLEGGYAFFEKRLLPLKGQVAYRQRPLSASLEYRRDLETKRPESLQARLSFAPRPFSLKASVGYRWDEDRYDPLTLRAAYALPGGAAYLQSRYDLNRGRFVLNEAALNFREGDRSLSLRARYDHRQEAAAFVGGGGLGPWRSGLRLSYALPDGVNDANDTEEGKLKSAFWLAYESHRLEFTATLATGKTESAAIAFFSNRKALEGYWDLALRVHLQDPEDPGPYLRELSLQSAYELTPALAVQGGIAYRRDGDEETLSFQNFGLVAKLYDAQSTRVFLGGWINQTYRLKSGEVLVQPRVVLTYDRCCWAFRFSLDTQNEEIRLSWLYGGQNAGIVLDAEGVHLPGESWP